MVGTSACPYNEQHQDYSSESCVNGGGGTGTEYPVLWNKLVYVVVTAIAYKAIVVFSANI